jgi:hypothetical protein
MTKKIKFWLDGCDISFVAEAPEDITLKQLLKQCDRIKPNWCACGIKSIAREDLEKYPYTTDIFIDYEDIRKADDNVSCSIKEE